MRTRVTLAAADVRHIMASARAEAERQNLAVAIAIVDEAGVLMALERLDDARLHTPESATLKARTAAIVRAPTAKLQEGVRDNPALLAFPDRLPLAGGMPLKHAGVVVGGIGSSGAAAAQDEQVCAAGLRALAEIGAGNEPT